MEKTNKKQSDGEQTFESTVVTSIEKLQGEEDRRAYILFLSGPLQGKLYCLEKKETVIGRGEEVDIPIRDNRVSRKHLKISLHEGDAVAEDLKSTNGTFINGSRVSSHVLENGDKIQISSSTVIKFAYGDKGERMFHDEFYQMANFDAVTGVHNKRHFQERLREEFSLAKRKEAPLSLLMLDIDFFKKVNDTHGHLAGDFVLSQVANQIRLGIRDEDILSRYGGEEFAVILRGIEIAGAIRLAERIRETVAGYPFEFEGATIPVTISVGVATLYADNFKNPKELISAADEFLYASKKNGRNRVTAPDYTTK